MSRERQRWADNRTEACWGEGCGCPLLEHRMLPQLVSALKTRAIPPGEYVGIPNLTKGSLEIAQPETRKRTGT